MRFILCTLFVSSSLFSIGQNKNAVANSPSKPKLIVGIMVDQMRWDYLYRFADKYGETGFKRLLREGYSCENTHINYVPTYTAPGHTCAYTGSVPSLHGIIGNDWYNRETGTEQYCTSDTSYHTVGATGEVGQMSPSKMLTTTVTDELRVASNFHSKVIGIALKDRSAIFPAGHAANGAFWFDGASGNFISSSYYADTLPTWLTTFNAQKLPAKYVAENWKTALALNQYTESTEDDKSYEKSFKGESKPVFPHAISEMTKKGLDIIRNTPWGNTITFDLAKAAVAGEKMGMRGITDFLAISCSSTDYIGHQFGPNSVELEDCYIRFDKDLGAFLTYLDGQVGVGNYTVFLSADHGAAHAEGFSREHHINTGVFQNDSLEVKCNEYLKTKLGKDSLVEAFGNFQFYFRHTSISEATVKATLTPFLLSQKGIAKVLDLANINDAPLPAAYREVYINGYNQRRSGDIQVLFEPAILEGYTKGTTHGTPYAYDTHIPLLWFGTGVKAGKDYSSIAMTDIAPTIAAMLHIQEPSGNIGHVIEGVVKK